MDVICPLMTTYSQKVTFPSFAGSFLASMVRATPPVSSSILVRMSGNNIIIRARILVEIKINGNVPMCSFLLTCFAAQLTVAPKYPEQQQALRDVDGGRGGPS